MQTTLTAAEWDELERAQHREQRVRNWQRYQAIRLLAEGQTPLEVAAALGCRKSSVYNWIGMWKQWGLAGLHEGHNGGVERRRRRRIASMTCSRGADDVGGLHGPSGGPVSAGSRRSAGGRGHVSRHSASFAVTSSGHCRTPGSGHWRHRHWSAQQLEVAEADTQVRGDLRAYCSAGVASYQ